MNDEGSVILFDGVCNFCNGAVNFVIAHDAGQQFRFASLQSDYAQKLLLKHHFPQHQLDTVVLIENGILFQKSTAALRIARRLRGWGWLYGLRRLPVGFRDFVYDLIAKYRYQIFGKANTCRLPSAQEKALFLG
jgi:predicted DCC family thiol-disulfide oxidoreductase YuxK